MKTFLPGETPQPKFHELMLSAVAPRPIAFVSTVDKEGQPNLSPFSFFNVFGSNPPICVFSPARSGRTGQTKNTFDNVMEVKECVVNIVNEDMLHQMNLASGEYPKGVNEFVKAGFTMLASDFVSPPRVAESFAQLECKVLNVIETGTGGGAGNLIICEILCLHFNENVLDENNSVDPVKMKYIARMGKDFYCRADASNIFEVAKPKANSNLGIGFDALPNFILTSKILTGNDLAQLASVHEIPALSREENSTFKKDNAHQAAQQLIQQGNLVDAWKILLASQQ